MTKLIEDIKNAMEEKDREAPYQFTSEDYAKAASEVAKRYIEKALHDAYHYGVNAGSAAANSHDYTMIGSHVQANNWLKENGVTGEVNS